MARIVVTEFVSLDGVMEGPGGDNDFVRGAWSFQFDRGEEGDKFNSMPKYVVSSTLEDPDWNNTTVLKGDVMEEVSKLRAAEGGDVYVHGSATLVHTLVEHDLVDELHLMVFPVVLGTGIRLFDDTTDMKRLRLTDSKVVGDGVAILVYQPDPEAG